MDFLKTTFLVSIGLFTSLWLPAQSWQQVASLPAQGRNHMAMFSIGTTGYALTGGWFNSTGTTGLKDFYKYDPSQDQWTQMTDFPGVERNYAVGIEIGGKGYLGFGQTYGPVISALNDLWEFDPATEMWTQKTSCPCLERFHPAYTTVNGKLYVGLGEDWPVEMKDWWEYDPGTDTWTQLPDFPGLERHHPMAFSIGDKAYVGFGHTQSSTWQVHADLYEYDVPTSTWTQRSDIPNGSRVAGFGFSAFNKGYIIAGKDSTHAGYLSEFWEYDGPSDTWTALPSFPSLGRWAPGGFMIGSDFYFGTGQSSMQEENDFWKYSFTSVGLDQSVGPEVSYGPNPADQELRVSISDEARIRILDCRGKVIIDQPYMGGTHSIELSDLSSGSYFLKVSNPSFRKTHNIQVLHN